MKLTREQLEQLREPFPADSVKWKPQTVREGRALAVAYIDARDVMDRLDEVVGGDWSTTMEVIDGGHVVCSLTVGDATRSDAGECGDSQNVDPLKSATSDAFKRAAVHFGIARYLYALPLTWVDYDERSKRIVSPPRLPDWALPSGNGCKPVRVSGIDAQAKAARRDAPPADTVPRRSPPRGATVTDTNTDYQEVIEQEAKIDSEADAIIAKLRTAASVKLGTYSPRQASQRQAEMAAKSLRALFGDIDDDSGRAMRRDLIDAVFDVKPDGDEDSWQRLDMHHAGAFIDWAIIGGEGRDKYDPNPEAVTEAAVILAAYGEAHGQQSLPIPESESADEPSLGDKAMALATRCATIYLDEEASADRVVGVLQHLFEKGFASEEPQAVAHAIVNEFDMILARAVAEELGANFRDIELIGALAEAHGTAGKKTAVAALEARAEWIHGWVATQADPDAEDGVSDVPF